MKKIIGIILGLLLVLNLSVSTVVAAEFRFSEDDGNITVSENEDVKNLYVGGGVVTIRADVQKSLYVGGSAVTIDGDVEDNLFVGGGTVTINGDVGGSVKAGGGTVTINGNVGGSVHVGGGTVSINGNVADDLFVGAGTASIADSVTIGEDLVIGGGIVKIRGSITGNVLLGGGEAIIDNTVGGSIKADVDTLKLGEKAVIAGDITYKATKEMEADENATILGEVDYSKTSETNIAAKDKSFDMAGFMPALVSVGLLVKLLASFVTAMVIIWLFGKKVQTFIQEALGSFWSNVGVGFAVLIVAPIIGILLLITIIGGGVTGILFSIYAVLLAFARPLGSIAFGSWIMKKVSKQSKYVADWKAAAIGVLAISIISWIPMIGWLAKFVLILVGFGTLYRLAHKELVAKK